jgi:nucleotide-binding universal stress UspA family protein
MIKDVLVHLDGSHHDEERLQQAEAVASIFQAHVTGLFTNPLPDLPMIAPMDAGAGAAEVLVSLTDEAKRAGDEVQRRLAQRFARLGVPNELRRVDALPREICQQAAAEARWADVFVVSRPYAKEGSEQWADLFETVLFEGGRSVLAVPSGRHPADTIRRILVGWRDTREAARAVAEAAPLIARTTRTQVLLVDPPAMKDGSQGEPAADIARHLGRLGSSVEVRTVESQGRDVSEVLLEQADRMPADLIVMGGYGHSRAREWMLGGATRDMLSTSDIPILMAH